MRNRLLPWCLVLGATALAHAGVSAAVTFDNSRVRVILANDATCQTVMDKATMRDYCVFGAKMPFAVGRIAGRKCPANAVELAEPASKTSRVGEMTVSFAGTDTKVVYTVTVADDWIEFRVKSVLGTRFDSLTLAQFPISITDNVGPRLNGAWDDKYAVCLMATTMQTDGGASAGKDYATLAATTQDAPGPKIEGAGAALIAAPTPQIRKLLERAAEAFGMPTNHTADGVPSKETTDARGSYWFITLGAKDVDQIIAYCEKTGFRQVMMTFNSWAKTAGHYEFNANFPGGKAELKRFIDALHSHGIKVGMHCFASKVSGSDSYVTPVPDKRFWSNMRTVLADGIDASQTAIRAGDLGQWPGSPVCARKIWEGGVALHQKVIIGDEIIQYDAIGPEGKYDTFLGCHRGYWGTGATAHAAGDTGLHWDIDDCVNGPIVDQETTLLDEMTTRLADIFNDCSFDMIYFDGGEDVPKNRFNYYVSKFQATMMSKIKRRPLIHMGTIMTHQTWHSFTRSSTVDVYLATLYGAIISGAKIDKWPTVKQHIDRSVDYMLSVRKDMMPGELGWFGIWPKGNNTDGLQLDEIEYLMCKSLGYDVPISLETSFGQMESHLLTPGILEIVKAYETLRMKGMVPEGTRRRLQEKGRDFVLVYGGQNPAPSPPHAEGGTTPRIPAPFGRNGKAGDETPHFVEVTRVPQVAGNSDLRAFVGEERGGSVATIWHYTGKQGQLVLMSSPGEVSVTGVLGRLVNVANAEGHAALPIGERRLTIHFANLSPDRVSSELASAQWFPQRSQTLWLRAKAYARCVGKMSLASAAGVTEPEALSDPIVCTGAPELGKVNDWYCEYRVRIPHDGRWTIWSRVRYPSGADDSFGIVIPPTSVTLQGDQVLGNCGQNGKKWHWTGRGGGSTSVPPAEPVTFRLKQGDFTFRIYAREGPGTAAMNPRLDVFCITDDSTYVPDDADAKAGLGSR